jgi:hypothetical protein
MHLTTDEALALFNLEGSTKCTSDNSWEGTADDLLGMFLKSHKSTKQDFEERFKKDFTQSLHH